MSIRINTDDCIGCGVCAQLCPECFAINEAEGHAVAISREVTPSVRAAADSCPLSAIIID